MPGSTVLIYLVAYNRLMADIAMGLLVPPARSLRDVCFIGSNELESVRRIQGTRPRREEVMFVDGWRDGRYAYEIEQEFAIRGLDIAECGKVYT